VRVVTRAYDAVDGADVLALLTEWRSYRAPNFELIRSRMRSPSIVDARNVWGNAGLAAMGFAYRAIGLRGAR
jgi:UDPglucose 6-dehydrogenase